jgi:hypothetical protein
MPQFRDAVGASSVCRNVYLPGLLGQTCDKQGLWVCSSALLGTGKAICSPRGSDPFNWLTHNVPRSLSRSPSYGIRARHRRCSGNAQLLRYKTGPDLHATTKAINFKMKIPERATCLSTLVSQLRSASHAVNNGFQPASDCCYRIGPHTTISA